jgi:hypothetical protein
MFLGRTLTKSAPLIGKNFFSNTASPFQKLYVGNLTWTQTEDSLRTLFSKHGEINDLFLVRDRLTGLDFEFQHKKLITILFARKIKRFCVCGIC